MFTPESVILPAARRLRELGFEFYIASNQAVRPALDTSPGGFGLHWVDSLDSTGQEWSVNQFLTLYNLIDGLAFGVRGLPMPQWVMVDLALLPSAVVIAATSRDYLLAELADDRYSPEVRAGVRSLLDQADDIQYRGPIPVAAYCAAPSAARERWVGWSLWSLLTGKNLATVVKGLALAVYRARYLDGVTQFDNVALHIHTKFGPLRLRSASLAVHTSRNSFVYETDLGADLNLPSEPTFLLDPRDSERQTVMQKQIEAGSADFFVLPPGIVYDHGRGLVPILELVPTS